MMDNSHLPLPLTSVRLTLDSHRLTLHALGLPLDLSHFRLSDLRPAVQHSQSLTSRVSILVAVQPEQKVGRSWAGRNYCINREFEANQTRI
jgi:hypothetical protein